MNLVITNNNGYFELKGVLDKFSVFLFRKEFENIFEKADCLTINIETLDDIDIHGVNALVRLHNLALTYGKTVTIIGLKNEKEKENFIMLKPSNENTNNFSNIYELQ
jgi:ABC-type transporter Mla MlaB component